MTKRDDNREKNQLKQAFDGLNPTGEQLNRIWQKIETGEVTGMIRYIRPVKYAVAAAAVVVIISLSGIGINAATDGKVSETISDIWSRISGHEQEIVNEAVKIPVNGIEVYAPEILYIDDYMLIFGTQRGVIVYDRRQSAVIGTIDTQSIGCNYFDGDRMQTCVAVSEDGIAVFNAERERPFGSYYLFDLIPGTDGMLKLVDTGDSGEKLDEYYKLWDWHQMQRMDTFDYFIEKEQVAELVFQDEKDGPKKMYSRFAASWINSAGEYYTSFLVIRDNEYELFSFHERLRKIEILPLNLEIIAGTEQAETTIPDEPSQDTSQTAENQSLPEFVYTGDDPAVKAICAYMKQEQGDHYLSPEGSVWIPHFIVLKQIEEGDELLVFGNFWTMYYVRIGNMLENCSGGECPACFHLKKTADGYTVIGYDQAEDGSGYTESIRRFTEGYQGVYEAFMNLNNEQWEAARKEYVRMYVENHHLPIEFVKDYGWDPVNLY